MRRRSFLSGVSGAMAAGATGLPFATGRAEGFAAPAYRGPRVIIIRFGGGVRRRETIDPAHSYAPFLLNALAPHATLFPDMRIAGLPHVATSHGHGTLYILTGRYESYDDAEGRIFAPRYAPGVPTLFEYFRRAFAVPPHQALLVNSEDRPQEEFLTFGAHHLYGVDFRCEMLSLYRYKRWLLAERLAEGGLNEDERQRLSTELADLQAQDLQSGVIGEQSPAIRAFWQDWRAWYGDSGLVNPRGDRLLTTLAERAMRLLQPALIMINYQDPDYVQWGNPAHYRRAIAVIDEGIARLVDAAEADEAWRGNTVFIIVPDCGRDDNRLMAVPYQHHFNTASAREIWAMILGPGVPRGVVVDRPVDQSMIAATVGGVMGFETPFAEGPALAEAFA